MRLVFLPWLVALASLVFAVTVGGYALLRPDPFSGLVHVSEFDYTNTYPPEVGLTVVCTAWTNDPERDFDTTPDKTWVGVRYIRDCVIR